MHDWKTVAAWSGLAPSKGLVLIACQQMRTAPNVVWRTRTAPTSNFVRNITRDARDGVGFATESGLHKLRPATRRHGVQRNGKTQDGSAAFTGTLDVRLIDQTFVLHESRDGMLWIGTRGIGVKGLQSLALKSLLRIISDQ